MKFKFKNKRAMVAEVASYSASPEDFNTCMKLLSIVESVTSENGGYVSVAFSEVISHVAMTSNVSEAMTIIASNHASAMDKGFLQALKKTRRNVKNEKQKS